MHFECLRVQIQKSYDDEYFSIFTYDTMRMGSTDWDMYTDLLVNPTKDFITLSVVKIVETWFFFCFTTLSAHIFYIKISPC